MESLLSGVPLLHRHYLRKPALDRLARDRARVHQADDAPSVDEHGRRHAAERVALAHLSDRKSTRLNSSHLVISYAVFCLKKKNKDGTLMPCLDSSHPSCHSHLPSRLGCDRFSVL